MLRKLALVTLTFVVVLLVIAALLPRDWRVEASALIAAPPARVLPWVASPRRWRDWTSWAKADPRAVHTFAGPDSGAGARWQWHGPTMGRGALTITSADETGVSFDEAIESDVVNARGHLRFSTEEAGTRVSWLDEGTLPPLGGLFRDMVERALHENLRSSLARLAALAEAPERAVVPTTSPEAR